MNFVINNNQDKQTLFNYLKELESDYIVKVKEFIQKEIPVIQKYLTRAARRVGSKIVKIKLHEVNSMLSKISNSAIIRDKHVLTILKYHELIKELNKMEKK